MTLKINAFWSPTQVFAVRLDTPLDHVPNFDKKKYAILVETKPLSLSLSMCKYQHMRVTSLVAAVASHTGKIWKNVHVHLKPLSLSNTCDLTFH